MMKTVHERRVNAMKNPKLIRNICVIAHVDHGKTTLSDNLIGSNSIISENLAGKIRYLDSREDEQLREITMKSSSIALLFEDKYIEQEPEDFELFNKRKNEEKSKKKKSKKNSKKADYLINLIDSPGHVEFKFEVTSGLKVCDGAVLVVDTYEGVCSQTITNLKKAVNSGLSMVLVINKLDKFMIEEGIGPMETYQMINVVIGAINAALNSAINAKLIEEYGEKGNQELLEVMFEKYSFDPLKNNVIFASAYDGWGFTLDDFTGIISKKYGFSKKGIKKFLWGDFYYNKKTKKMSTKPVKEGDTPLFVKLILKNIYQVYEKIYIEKKTKSLKSMGKKLGFEIPDMYLYNADEDPQALSKSFMSKWLPLHQAIFKMVVRKIPNPQISQKLRINEISKDFKKARGNKKLNLKYKPFKEGIENADENSPLMAFVSKMNPLTTKSISEMGLVDKKFIKRRVVNELKFYAFARIFSGKIRRGDKVKVHLLTKEMLKINKKKRNQAKIQVEEVTVDKVYIWMGQHLQGVEEVGPGCICGLSGLGGFGFKSVTISNSLDAPLLSKIEFEQNLLKVSLKTKIFENNGKLIEALKRLVKADPVIDVYYGERGDLIIETGGEVHLQRCMKDLEDYTEDIEIIASDPIIAYKETIIHNYVKKKKKFKKMKREIIKENKKIFEEDKRKDRLKELGIDEEEKEEGEEEVENEENDEQQEEEEVEEEINQEDLPPEERIYRFNTESSSFFDTTSEEEVLDDKAILNKAIDEWSDSGEGKEDHVDERMEIQESVQLYQDRKEEIGNVTKKAKTVKFAKNKFVDMKDKSNIVEIETPNRLYKLTIQAVGMNQEFAHWLFKQKRTLRRLFKSKTKNDSSKKYIQFFTSLRDKLEEYDSENYLNKLIMRYLSSFGPSKMGNNMLLYFFSEPEDSLIGQYLSEDEMKEHFGEYFIFGDYKKRKKHRRKLCKLDYKNKEMMEEWFNGITYGELETALESGFNIATENGPLCDEEMYGTIFIVQDFKSTALNKKRIAEARADMMGMSKKKEEINEVIEENKEDNEAREGEETEKIEELKTENLEEKTEIEEVEKEEMTENKSEEAQEEETQNPDENKEEITEKKPEEEMEPKNGLNSPPNTLEPNQDQEDTEEEKEMEPTPTTPENKKVNPVAFDPFGPISGQILSTMKSACQDAFLGAEPRLVQGLFLVTLFCEYDLYGKACEVLSRRKAKILGSEYQDITNMFIVEAQLPIQESFGFYEEMMIQTSGRVIPQLAFDSWSMIKEDPFYKPQTLDEVVEHGENVNVKNHTRNMIEKIRESKGLATDKKIVIDADKQDTIAKKR